MNFDPQQTLLASGWKDYELIDSGNGNRLERYGRYRLIRPDPQAIWKTRCSANEWNNCDARYIGKGKSGMWEKKPGMPEEWPIKYKNITYFCRLTPFKHTGIFPEQSSHWEWLKGLIESEKQPNILNLFGYTGAASLVAAAAGAKVTHVDASYQAIGWARKNQEASGLTNKPIRWILDDVVKFTKREIRRGIKYDGIIMDPPIYGHGPNGETWNFDQMFPALMDICVKLLTPKPLCFLVNAYAISASSIMLENVVADYFGKSGGSLKSGELMIKEKTGRFFSTGIYARWNR